MSTEDRLAYLTIEVKRAHDLIERLEQRIGIAKGVAVGPWTWSIDGELLDAHGIGVRFDENKHRFAAVPRMLDMLHKLEWAGTDVGTDCKVCPVCDAMPPTGSLDGYHEPECSLAALLKELR